MTNASDSPTRDPLASRRAMGRSFESLREEHGFVPLRVEGELPRELVGTLYRNGPALFECQGTQYRHWLDGDGAITAVRLFDGRAEGAVRVTVTAELAEERARGEMLYSSGFTLGPYWHKRLFGHAKNPTSIHVLAWRDRLFALGDAGIPYELDPKSLETKGPWDLDGVKRELVNAHVRVRPSTGDVIAFGESIGVRNTLDVYVLPPTGAPRLLAAIPCARPPLLAHDIVITERYAVLILPPVHVAVTPILLGTGSPMDAISFHEAEGCEVIVLPFDDPRAVVRFRVPTFSHFHYANAFESGPDAIAVDLCRYPRFDLGTAFMLEGLRTGDAWSSAPVGNLSRLHIDLAAKRAEWEVLWDANVDFPQTHPDRQGRPYRYLWALTQRDHVDFIEKRDLSTGEVARSALPSTEYPGEPTFVPRPEAKDEDDGWVLTLAYEAATHTSALVILDARDPSKVVARAHFGQHIPFPLHGTFHRG
ncbi:MAG: carotenoid oxygenase family protein [Myxococcales bacterium]|nr:carotenoid oxygenase family protein [Myxococcales bacterium]